MRLSNGIAKLENGLGTTLNWLGIKAADARANIEDKVDALRTQYRATQLHDIRVAMKTMPPLDRQEVELRAAEIGMIKDATAVRRAERKLRRDLARKIIKGEIDFEPYIPGTQR